MHAYKLVITAVLMLVHPSILLAQTPPGGTVEILDGVNTIDTTCAVAGSVCAGDMVTCQAGEGIIINKASHQFLKDVCDDASDRPCQGRLTVLQEDCFDANFPPMGRDIKVNGNVLTITTRGRYRVCFDASAASDCTGATPAGAIIAEGASLCQNIDTFVPPGENRPPIQFTCQAKTDVAPDFVIDGVTTRYNLPLFNVFGRAQADINNDNCLSTNPPNSAAGCGFAGTSVATPER